MESITIITDYSDYGMTIKRVYEKEGFHIAGFIVPESSGLQGEIDGVCAKTIGGTAPSELEGVSMIVAAFADEEEGEELLDRLMSLDPDGFQDKQIVIPDAGDIQRRIRKYFPFSPERVLSNTEPLSRLSGLDRGEAIDRYYIEKFLREEAEKLGEPSLTLEVGDDRYSTAFFPKAEHEILNYLEGMDLTDQRTLPSERYDVFICTQTFPHIYDVRKAVSGAKSVLKPGGVLLATVCGCATQLSKEDGEWDKWDHFWGFTEASFRRLLSDEFGEEHVRVKGYGNAMAATAFIQGLSQEDIDISLLDKNDSDFSIVICAAAVKR